MSTNNLSKVLFLLVISTFLLLQGCSGNSEPMNTISTESPSLEEPIAEIKPSNNDSPVYKGYWSSFPYVNDSELTKVNQRGYLLLTEEQAIEDYHAMWKVLDDNFSLLSIVDTFPDKYDLDYIKEVGEKDLLLYCKNGEITQPTFIYAINNCLKRFNVYGHLSILSPELYNMYIEIIENILNPENDYDDLVVKITNNMFQVIDNAKTQKFYDYFRELPGWTYESTITESSTQQNLKEAVDNSISSKYIDDIPYIKIGSFGWQYPEQADIAIKTLNDILAEYKDAENIIIDIRNNDGGYTDVWLYGIVKPLLNEKVVVSHPIFMNAGLYNKYLWGSDKLFENASKPDVEELSNSYPYINESTMSKFDQVYIEETVHYPSPERVGYSGKVWVLINEYVYSTADAFAYFCKSTGFGTLVGKTTLGNGLIDKTPVTFALPNSGLLIRYQYMLGFNNDDGSCNLVTGTKPDIEIGLDENALDVCIDLIKSTQ